MKLSILHVVAISALAMGTSQARVLAGHYDGFCDGFSLTLSANGAAYGFETGCVTGAIAGARSSFRKGAVINEPHVSGTTVYKIDEVAHTWTIYQTDGAILQQGTWTAEPAGPAANNRGGPATGTK